MAESEDKIMKSFPFDSQVSYDSFGNPSYDRAVNSAELAENIALLYTNGVLTNPSTCLQVTESESQMSVQVLPGACNINGRLGREDNTRTIVFEAADSAYDRIDRVVLRLNTNVDIRAIDIYVLKGTPAATPTAPALTRTGGIYELCLADVFIAKNTAYISAARITDTRMNDELCGYMMTNPQSIDATTIFNQYQAALDEFLKFADSCISETVVGEIEENFAPLYSTTTDYKVGDMVTHNAKYYVCQAETSGTWDESKWIRTNVSGQIAQINNDLSDIQTDLSALLSRIKRASKLTNYTIDANTAISPSLTRSNMEIPSNAILLFATFRNSSLNSISNMVYSMSFFPSNIIDPIIRTRIWNTHSYASSQDFVAEVLYIDVN